MRDPSPSVSGASVRAVRGPARPLDASASPGGKAADAPMLSILSYGAVDRAVSAPAAATHE